MALIHVRRFLSACVFSAVIALAVIGSSAQMRITRSFTGLLTGTAATLQFGGTSNLFPMLKRVATGLEVRLADDSGLAPFSAGSFTGSTFSVQTSLNGYTKWYAIGAPTINSGFGTSAAVTLHNGSGAFVVNVGTGGVATSGVITLPATTTNGWICHLNNLTAAAGHRVDNTRQIATAATTVTVENQNVTTGAATAWAASDSLQLACFGY